jgi:hypothetical protein
LGGGQLRKEPAQLVGGVLRDAVVRLVGGGELAQGRADGLAVVGLAVVVVGGLAVVLGQHPKRVGHVLIDAAVVLVVVDGVEGDVELVTLAARELERGLAVGGGDVGVAPTQRLGGGGQDLLVLGLLLHGLSFLVGCGAGRGLARLGQQVQGALHGGFLVVAAVVDGVAGNLED